MSLRALATARNRMPRVNRQSRSRRIKELQAVASNGQSSRVLQRLPKRTFVPLGFTHAI